MRLHRLIAAAAACALAVSAHAQVLDGPRPDDGYFQQATRVAAGVWVLAQPRFQVQPAGNVTVIEHDDGLILVDCGGSPGAARRVVAIVKALSPKPVKAIVVTHWHGDHAQGLDVLLRTWPAARTIATRATQAHLSDPRTMNTPASADPVANAAFQTQAKAFVAYARDMAAKARDPREIDGWSQTARLFRQYAADMDGALTVPVAEGVDGRLDLPDRNRPAQVLYLGRANTDGDALVWLPRQRVVITGDIVVAPFPYGYGSYPADWLRTLDRLGALPFRTLVPGHGAPQHDRRYLARISAALADIRTQVAPLAAEDLQPGAVPARVSAHTPAQAFAADDSWLTRWVREFWLQPIAASAWKEARGQPISQSLRPD